MSTPRTTRPPLLASALLAAVLLAPGAAWGQVGRAVPSNSYYLAVQSLYDGEYTQSARAFLREQPSSNAIDARWIDSIAYHALRGEALFQMGLNRDALAEYNAACALYLANANWMLRVQFQQDPRPDNNPRRVAPWGPPARRVTYGQLPDTMLIAYGQVDNSQVANQGGVVRQAQFWKVNVAELNRATVLAIRRRNQLLGPLGPHDKLSRELADTLIRGGNAPANHWSSAWTDLLTGLAQLGVQKPQEAAPYLNRALLLGGRYDHALTGAALLAQAQLALMTDNAQAVPRLAREASLAAFAFDDWDVLCDSLAMVHVTHLAGGAKRIDPTLPLVAAWADRERADHITSLTRLMLAEQYAAIYDTPKASAMLSTALPLRDVGNGRLGPYYSFLGAKVALQAGKHEEGQQAIDKALARYAEVSLTNFQLVLANERYDSGEVSPRIAVDVYQTLLTDPSELHWVFEPIDAMATLRTNHEAAFNRWITAALSRREILPALYATDLAKRRRFFSYQPLGGRLIALRGLLSSPEAQLDARQRLQRQALLARSPQYGPLAQQSAAIAGELAAEKGLFSEENSRQDLARFDRLERLSVQRERLTWQLALDRLPSEMAFPPRRSAEDLRKSMVDGDALLVFHQTGDAMHGFLVAKQGEHYWRLPNAPDVRGKVGQLLRELGNHSSTASIDSKNLTEDQWRTVATQLGAALLGESRLDLRQTKRLVIVPDGPLWYLPFGVLMVGDTGETKMIADATPLRCAPTMGLAFGDKTPWRPLRHTGIAMDNPSGGNDEREMQQMTWDGLKGAVESPVRLPVPTPNPSPLVASATDALVVLIDESLDADDPYAWTPLPIDRHGGGTLAQWIALPLPGPERMILAGLHTAAENGLKGTSRRNPRKGASLAPGMELFHAACGLMSAGSRTVLLSRWQTGGAAHRNLVQEFAAEWTRQPAAEAWARSVLLARSTRLDPDQEPRFKARSSGEEIPTADHPFFWSGYLLLDTGYAAPKEAEAAPPKPPVEAEAQKKEPEKAAPAEAAPEQEDEYALRSCCTTQVVSRFWRSRFVAFSPAQPVLGPAFMPGFAATHRAALHGCQPPIGFGQT